MSDIVMKHTNINAGDITDGLRELIAEAKKPGMYTPDERQVFADHWIGVLSPARLAALLDEIERLRHPKIIVGSRKLWEAMGEIVGETEIEQARTDALEEAAQVAETLVYRSAYPREDIATAIRALKET